MNSVERFSSRVEDYVRYRPGYPRALLETLARDCGFGPESVVADIGCGPGNLAAVFLENGNAVHGVEPNSAMREAGRALLARFEKFDAREGSAEATGLPAESVDFVTAGQAFHWFDPPAARAEFRRILKPGGWVALAWNERGRRVSGFLDEYEELVERHAPDYRAIRERRNDEKSIAGFFGGGEVRRALYEHSQWFDFEGVKGRLLSSSYTPQAGHPNHLPMLEDLRRAFERHAREGRVEFPYEMTLWYGRLGAGGA
ncbi:MAG TPA: class I SAM-dependent methyltransferase [Bryobacteraceae bacterium]|nr:class I SAM-dependent methyltransferase [Bryobacteraceae bacterium]